MARYVLPIAGAVVGGIFGGPMGAQIGWSIGSALGGLVDPQVIKGPSIGDIAQQTSQEGVPRPIVFGLSQPMAGNIIATSEPNIVRRQESQGKGGPKVETESVYRTYAIRICEGPIAGVVRVWRNNQLVYDARENSSMSAEDNALFLDTARFFLGDFEQNPSPDLEAVFGVGVTPAHRGTAYMVMANEDLTDLRGAIPTYQFQVSGEGGGAVLIACARNGTASQRFARSIDGGTTWEMLTNPEMGGTPPEWMDMAFSPTLGRVVVVGTPSLGFDTAYSDDFGDTWTLINSGVTATTNNWWRVRWIEPADASAGFFLASLFSTSGNNVVNQLRKSFDGIIWTAITLPSSGAGDFLGWAVQDFAYSPTLNRIVVYADPQGGVAFTADVLYSDDLGSTWTFVSVDGIEGYNGNAWNFGTIDWDSQREEFKIIGGAYTNGSGTSWAATTAFTADLRGGRFIAELGVMVAVGPTTNEVFEWGGGTIGTPGDIPDSGAFWSNVAYDVTRARAMIIAGGGTKDKFAYRAAGENWTVTSMPEAREWSAVVAAYDFADALSLPAVVAALCDRAGMTADMYDVSQLDEDQDVHGLTVINTYPAYSAIQSLSQIFFFSPSYYDGVVHFIHAGQNSVGTITEDEMLDDHEIEIEESLRDDPISIPRVMHMLYYDVDGGLATDKQTSERAGDYRSLGEQSIQSPVVMVADQAARAVAINHKVTIENLRGTLKFCLPDSLIRYIPNDPVVVQWQGLSKRVRLTKVEVLDGYQQYEALHDRQSAYTSEVEGIPAAPQTPPPSNIVGPTLIEPLDIHILRDVDDNAGLIYYVAISGTLPAWNGALVELSLDGGANYTDALSSSVATIMGELSAPLNDHPQEYPDEINTLAVTIATPFAVLDETDLEGLLNRVNFAIVGNEIIQFANADETSEGHWELSLMLRGRKGTQTNYWPAGTRFVLLTTATLGTIPANLVDLGRTLTFRATSFGDTVDNGTVVSMLYTGRSQIEREVAYLAAHIDGSDAVITWQGVGRLGAGAQAAHGVRFAGYRVTLTGDNAVVITVDTDDEFLTQDVSTLTQPITISVLQLNDLTGEGPAVELII